MIDYIALFRHLPEMLAVTAILALVAGTHYLFKRMFRKYKERQKKKYKLH